MKNSRVRQQHRIPGLVRIPTSSSLLPKLRKVVEHEANHFKCSKAFIVSVALADYFGVDIDEDYHETRKKRA